MLYTKEVNHNEWSIRSFGSTFPHVPWNPSLPNKLVVYCNNPVLMVISSNSRYASSLLLLTQIALPVLPGVKLPIHCSFEFLSSDHDIISQSFHLPLLTLCDPTVNRYPKKYIYCFIIIIIRNYNQYIYITI